MMRLGAVTAVLISTDYSTRMCWRNRTHARINLRLQTLGDQEFGYQDGARRSAHLAASALGIPEARRPR
jgi:hypothetical protein